MHVIASRQPQDLRRLRWSSIVAALLSIVAGLALALLLVVAGLRCVDMYRLVVGNHTTRIAASYSVSRSESALYVPMLPVWAHGAFGIRTPDIGAR